MDRKLEAERLNNLAKDLYAAGKRHTALALVRKAVNIEPYAECFSTNYAVILTNFGEYEKAENIFLEVLERKPDYVLAWHGYGVMCMVSAQPQKAVRCFKKCIELEPTNGSHGFDLSCAIIQLGDWEKGFELYETRRLWKPEREFNQFKSWQGQEGTDVYVWCEQGIGDCIQYARYIPWLVSISHKVTLAVPPYLYDLFSGFSKMVHLVSLEGAMVEADYQVPLMSLAHFYLKAGHKQVPQARNFGKRITRSTYGGKFRVGLCWACNSTSINYRERSLPFEQLLRLTEIDNTEFISLQVGEATAEIAEARAQNLVLDMSHEINGSWGTTSRLLDGCDFMISTDTSVAHLAATMNVPTVMFLARRDWWRWGNSGSTTPWYPSMTIIRQETPFKWEKEIKEAYAILENAAKNRTETLAA